jgi:acyl carrier protein
MNIRSIIIDKFHQVLDQTDNELTVTALNDEVVLLESGLDSLGFAILVAILEEELSFDPFIESDDASYPTTFGEFVNLYENRYRDINS